MEKRQNLKLWAGPQYRDTKAGNGVGENIRGLGPKIQTLKYFKLK